MSQPGQKAPSPGSLSRPEREPNVQLARAATVELVARLGVPPGNCAAAEDGDLARGSVDRSGLVCPAVRRAGARAECVTDLGKDLDLILQAPQPLLCQLVSRLRKLYLPLAQLVPADLLRPLDECHRRESEIRQGCQQDGDVVGRHSNQLPS